MAISKKTNSYLLLIPKQHSPAIGSSVHCPLDQTVSLIATKLCLDSYYFLSENKLWYSPSDGVHQNDLGVVIVGTAAPMPRDIWNKLIVGNWHQYTLIIDTKHCEYFDL